MRKIGFMAEEFFRSFHKSLFKNLILMVMFSISLVMTVIMGSYYFDLDSHDREQMTKQIGNRTWHRLDYYFENYMEIDESFTTVDGCQNMIDYCEVLRSSEEYSIISMDTPTMYAKENDIKKYFGSKSCINFQPDDPDLNGSFMMEFGDQGMCSAMNMKCVQLDIGACRLFGLEVQEGDGFTDQNTTLRHLSDPVPILLGSGYKGIIEPGDEMDVWLWGFVYRCKVVGILERGAFIPDRLLSYDPENGMLDNKVIMPFGIHLTERAKKVEEIKKYAFLASIGLYAGYVQIKDGGIREQADRFQRTAKEFGLPEVKIGAASMGLQLLSRESASTVMIMLILSVVLSCFTLYGMFITFYEKIQSNIRIYGIYLMNGCSVGMILIPLLLEIAVIIIPAVFFSNYMIQPEDLYTTYSPEAVMKVVYVITGFVFAAGAAFVSFLMGRIDTESLIRRNE